MFNNKTGIIHLFIHSFSLIYLLKKENEITKNEKKMGKSIFDHKKSKSNLTLPIAQNRAFNRNEKKNKDDKQTSFDISLLQ